MSLEAELKQCRKDKASIEDNERDILAQIQALEGVKLRLDDYGTFVSSSGNIGHFSVIANYSGLAIKYSTNPKEDCSLNDQIGKHTFTKLGNLADDIKAMSEDVTEFKVDGVIGKWCSSFPKDIILHDKCELKGGIARIQGPAIDEFILSLRQLQATAKRKAAQ